MSKFSGLYPYLMPIRRLEERGQRKPGRHQELWDPETGSRKELWLFLAGGTAGLRRTGLSAIFILSLKHERLHRDKIFIERVPLLEICNSGENHSKTLRFSRVQLLNFPKNPLHKNPLELTPFKFSKKKWQEGALSSLKTSSDSERANPLVTSNYKIIFPSSTKQVSSPPRFTILDSLSLNFEAKLRSTLSRCSGEVF